MVVLVSGILVGLTVLSAIAILFCAKDIRGALILSLCWLAVVVMVTLGSGVLTGYPRQANSLHSLAYPFEASQVEVISFEIVPDVAIYIWARNDNRVPMNLALDWDSAMASGLYKAEEETKQNGGKVMLDLNGEQDRGDGLGQRDLNTSDGAGGGGEAGGGGGGTTSYGTASGASVFVGQSDFPLKE